MTRIRRLQQLWILTDGSVAWRDVPCVYLPREQAAPAASPQAVPG